MNYIKAYYELINSRKTLQREGYTEKHHIVPKGIYDRGLLNNNHLSNVDDEKNIVELTGREHFVAHWLLHRAFPSVRNLSAAFHAMATMANLHHSRYTPSSRAVEEARKDYAEAQKKPVAMYSLSGKLLKVFNTTENASLEIETNVHNISSACISENSIKGFQWRRFDKKPLKKIDEYINLNNEAKMMVHEYDLKGIFIKSYESVREAGRNGIDRSTFKTYSRSKPIFSKDKWYIVSNKPFKEKIKVQKTKNQRRKVHQIDIETGKVIKTWSSSREPQRVLGISNVSDVCNGKRKTMGGFIWKYSEEDYTLNLDHHKRKLANASKITIFKYGSKLGDFDSLRKASQSTGINRILLSKILKSQIEIKGVRVEQYNLI